MLNNHFHYDVIIAGGGPAGASAAIHLANAGARVLLAEQKKFPREKLCGEFISPECLLHFDKLGVRECMLAAAPAKLNETVFYSRRGKSVSVPSSWFEAGGLALGLSRAEMDERLLRRAAEAGVEVLENAHVTGGIVEASAVRGVVIKLNGDAKQYRAPLTIDATGRARVLGRRVEKRERGFEEHRTTLVAFKAHLENTSVAAGACEIYFYQGGYGGLSTIENGLSNLCFIAAAADVRALGGDAEKAMRKIVCQNSRAAETLASATAASPWLAVSLERFGRHALQPARGLIAIGDAASFIDPFTGSGMLMALQSGELIGEIVSGRLKEINDERGLRMIADRYRAAYQQRFGARLRLCSALRRAAFVPGLASLAISLFGSSNAVRRRLTLATRVGS
jgi:flavin-dependent dehydrogenase